MVIDIHTHYLGAEAARMIAAAPVPVPGLARDTSDSAPIRSLSARIDAMDAAGIAVSVVAPPPFGLIEDPGLRSDLVRAANDAVVEACALHPDRLVMSAALPLPDMDGALRELERLRGEPCLRSVTVVAQTTTYRPSTIGFGALVEALGDLPMILHPSAGVADLHPAFESFGLGSALQAPVSQALVVADVIATGLLDAFPDFAMILTHGGGGLPLLMERFDERLRGQFDRPPSEYLRTALYADTCGLRPGPGYRLMLETFGADRMMIGSDWPSRPIDTPIQALDAMGLPADQSDAIRSRAARRWFATDRLAAA